MATTDDVTQTCCAYCQISNDDGHLLKCSGCEVVWYCGKQHQQFDWKRHKEKCRPMQALRAQQRKRCNTLGACETSKSASSSLDNWLSSGHWSVSGRSRTLSKEEAAVVETLATLPSFGMSSRKRTSLDDKTTNGQLSDLSCRPKFFLHDDSAETEPMEVGPSSSTCDLTEIYEGTERTAIMAQKDHSTNRSYRVTLEQHLENCTRACPQMTQYQAFCLRVQNISTHVIERLAEFGWCLVDSFLADSHAQCVLDEVKTLYDTGLFSDGQLMKSKEGGSSKDIRSDKIYWFDSRDDTSFEFPNIGFLISMLDSLIVQISGKVSPNKINGRSRAMIACYPGNGTKYVRHVDNPIQDGRIITCIYYMNVNWNSECGGVLRLYPEGAMRPIDIEPFFDRLLLFWSDKRNPHEVFPVYNPRFALTVWYFDAEEKGRALTRLARQQRQSSAASLVDAVDVTSKRPKQSMPSRQSSSSSIGGGERSSDSSLSSCPPPSHVTASTLPSSLVADDRALFKQPRPPERDESVRPEDPVLRLATNH